MLPVAAHAVQPRCSRCGRPVLSSIEIGYQLSALQDLLAAALGDSTGGAALDDAVVAFAVAELKRLRAELAGDHLSCSCPAGSSDLDCVRRLVATR